MKHLKNFSIKNFNVITFVMVSLLKNNTTTRKTIYVNNHNFNLPINSKTMYTQPKLQAINGPYNKTVSNKNLSQQYSTNQ